MITPSTIRSNADPMTPSSAGTSTYSEWASSTLDTIGRSTGPYGSVGAGALSREGRVSECIDRNVPGFEATVAGWIGETGPKVSRLADCAALHEAVVLVGDVAGSAQHQQRQHHTGNSPGRHETAHTRGDPAEAEMRIETQKHQT